MIGVEFPVWPARRWVTMTAQAGAVALVSVGWYEASGMKRANDQVAWLGLSLVGLGASAAVNAWRLGRARRAVTLAREIVLPTPGRATRSTGESSWFVSGPNMSRVHRSSCLLVTGKPVERIDSDAAAASGLQPCEVCRP